MKKFGGPKKNAVKQASPMKGMAEPKKAVMKQGKGKRGKYIEDNYGGVPIR